MPERKPDPKVLIKKGYNVEVTSWENDADNFRTKTYAVETKEYAEALLKMCKELFCTYHDGDTGIGNMNDGDDPDSRIIQYVKKNPAILDNRELIKDMYVIDHIMGLHYELMGSSEWYTARVFDKGCIYYVPEDVTVDVLIEKSRY